MKIVYHVVNLVEGVLDVYDEDTMEKITTIRWDKKHGGYAIDGRAELGYKATLQAVSESLGVGATGRPTRQGARKSKT